MANYQQLKTAIQTAINNNGQGAITGQVLQDVLKDIVDVVGEGYTFVGLATTSTVPSVDDSKVFYLASQVGTYSNFGGIVVGEGLTVLKYDTAWSAVQVLSLDFIDDKLDTYIAQAQADIDAIVSDLESVSTEDVDAVKDILVANNYGYSVIQDIGHSTSTNNASIVRPNTGFSAIYKVNEGSEIYGAIVTMGGNDITSSAVTLRTKSYCRVSIASVTGNVEIVVIATKPIVFADNAVKAICVQNWGGQYVEGEITEYEASRVTTLAGQFTNNTTITSFDELRYFTGLTALNSAFEGCANLTSVILPKSPLTTLGAAFSGCTKLATCQIPTDVTWILGTSGLEYTFNKCEKLVGEVDLSMMKPSGAYVAMTRCFDTCAKITKVITPQGGIQIDRAWLTCSDLVTLQTDLSNIAGSGSNRLRNPTGGASSSTACKKLANITYGFRGANLNLQLGYAPLTHESVLQVINGLGTVSSATLTISAVSRATLTDDELAIAIGKGWSVATAG